MKGNETSYAGPGAGTRNNKTEKRKEHKWKHQ